MRRFGNILLATAGFGLLAACGGPETAPAVDAAAHSALNAGEPMAASVGSDGASTLEGDITPEGLARHIKTLASDEFEGRAPTTPGGEKTRAYIAAEYQRIGLEPVGGSWFQSAEMVETNVDPDQSYLRVDVNGE
ncbi:MAG: hypothetical protein KDE05_01000, partial [Parvularculaceae bacterium]|nr:hypothetical protein [Parvularculaceae bacterium]